MQAMHAMQTDWKFSPENQTEQLASGSGNAHGKGQQICGADVFAQVFKDCAQACSRKVLLINDYISAGGEGGIAAIAAKVGEEAVANNCNVCYWGFDFRQVWSERSRQQCSGQE